MSTHKMNAFGHRTTDNNVKIAVRSYATLLQQHAIIMTLKFCAYLSLKVMFLVIILTLQNCGCVFIHRHDVQIKRITTSIIKASQESYISTSQGALMWNTNNIQWTYITKCTQEALYKGLFVLLDIGLLPCVFDEGWCDYNFVWMQPIDKCNFENMAIQIEIFMCVVDWYRRRHLTIIPPRRRAAGVHVKSGISNWFYSILNLNLKPDRYIVSICIVL